MDELVTTVFTATAQPEQWYLWQDRPTRFSPMHNLHVRESELSAPVRRRRTLIVGPWAGSNTTLGGLIPTHHRNQCLSCGCNSWDRGGACRVTFPENTRGR